MKDNTPRTFAYLIIAILVALLLPYLKLGITGFSVAGERSYLEINTTYNQSTILKLTELQGTLLSLALNGEINGTGNLTITLDYPNESILIYTNKKEKTNAPLITGFAVSKVEDREELIPINKTELNFSDINSSERNNITLENNLTFGENLTFDNNLTTKINLSNQTLNSQINLTLLNNTFNQTNHTIKLTTNLTANLTANIKTNITINNSETNLSIVTIINHTQIPKIEQDIITLTESCKDSCFFEGNGTPIIQIQIEGNLELHLESLSYQKLGINILPEMILEIPSYNITSANITLNLSNYFRGTNLEYDIFSYDDNVELNQTKDLALFNRLDYGSSLWMITAFNEKVAITSNLFTINFQKEKPYQPKVEIGKSVKWIVKPKDKTLTIPSSSYNITFFSKGKHIGRLTQQSSSKKENKTINIPDLEDLEIVYFTPAPIAIEENISKRLKRVIISSDLHYKDIFAYTTIPDTPKEAIKLYRIVNETRKEIINFSLIDTDNSSMIDRLEWIVPHLSNQTYEIELNVLTLQSYPIVGGNWTVAFNTTGTSNLTISAIIDTTYGTSLPDDLTPISLFCGGTKINYSWDKLSGTINDSANIISVTDWNCDNQTGYWRVKVLTTGVHNQLFNFSGLIGYANNSASLKINLTQKLMPPIVYENIETNVSIYGAANVFDGEIIDNFPLGIWINGTRYTTDSNNLLVPLNTSWAYEELAYRKNLTIESKSSSTLALNLIKINFSTTTLVAQGKLNSDCSDLRFATHSGENIPLVIEPSSCNSDNTVAWLKTNITNQLWMYYGYDEASPPELEEMDSNLISFLAMDQSSIYKENSTFVKDLSMSSHDATCKGTSCPTLDSGYYGGAYNFDGSNDYFNLSYGSGINPSTQNLTIMFWAKPDAVSGAKILFSSGYSSNDYLYIGYIGSMWELGIQSSSWDGSGIVPVSTDWTHVALVMNTTDAILYINGIKSTQKSFTSYSLNQDFDLGHHAGLANYYNGTIDSFRMWNRVLSKEEILFDYNETSLIIDTEEKISTTDASGKYNFTYTANLTKGTYPIFVNLTYNGTLKTVNQTLNSSDEFIIYQVWTTPSSPYYPHNFTISAVVVGSPNYVNFTLGYKDNTIISDQSGTNLGNGIWRSPMYSVDSYKTLNFTITSYNGSKMINHSEDIILMQLTETLSRDFILSNETDLYNISVYGKVNLSNAEIVSNYPVAVHLNRTPLYWNSSDWWWNSSWPYRNNIKLESFVPSHFDIAIVQLTIDTNTLISEGKLRSDCGDMRFTNKIGTLIPYTLETSTCNSAETIFWLWTYLRGNHNNTLYSYYGNPSATLDLNYSNPDEDLKLYLHLDNSSIYGEDNDLVYDFSKKDNNATCTDCPVWNETGKFGGAYTFESSNSLAVSGNLSYDSFTVGFWFSPNEDYNETTAEYVSLVSDLDYEIFLGNGSMFFDYKGSSINSTQTFWNHSYWYYIVAIFDGSTQKLFIDFVAEEEGTIPSPFIIQDSSGTGLVSFYNSGNVMLKGSCSISDCIDSASASVLFQNSTGDVVASIDNEGNLCLEDSSCEDEDSDCDNPPDGSFIVQDADGRIVSYISDSGELCTIGILVQNGNPS